jgi:hypothetical protein
MESSELRCRHEPDGKSVMLHRYIANVAFALIWLCVYPKGNFFFSDISSSDLRRLEEDLKKICICLDLLCVFPKGNFFFNDVSSLRFLEEVLTKIVFSWSHELE